MEKLTQSWSRTASPNISTARNVAQRNLFGTLCKVREARKMGVLGQSLKSVNENIRLKNPVRGIAPVYEVDDTHNFGSA